MNNIESESHNLSGSVLFATPPPSNYSEQNAQLDAWDQSKPNDNNNSFLNLTLGDLSKQNPDEILNQLQQQQQMMMQQQQQHMNLRQSGPPRPLLDIQTNFSSPRHFTHHGPSTPDIMDSPHQAIVGMRPPPSPLQHNSFGPRFPHSPQMNFRGGGSRNSTPYQKGRGGRFIRNNYRGGGGGANRGKW